jgi:hypothetical protein
MLSGARGFDPYPEAWLSTWKNLIRVGYHYVGTAPLVAFFVTVIVETILWHRSRPHLPRRERPSAARLGIGVACGVAGAVILVSLMLVGTTPCTAYGSTSGFGSASVKCVESAGLDARVLYSAYVTGWVYGPVGLVLGAVVGSIVAVALRRTRRRAVRLSQLPPPAGV